MKEYKVIHKWFWIWDFEKEEDWLNGMAQSGWVLESVSFCKYRFAACEPGQYTIRMEMHPYDKAYVDFMRETGASYVGRMAQWVYFRRETALGSFDLFSDLDSRIRHLSGIGRCLLLLGIANLLIGLGNTINPVLNIGWINLLVATILMYGLGRIHGKKEGLEKERLLRE